MLFRSLATESDGSLGAYLESLDAAYRVGSRVVSEIATHWDKYADRVPSSGSARGAP